MSPEQQQLNYAQLIIEVADKEDTPPLVGLLQQALSSAAPDVRMNVRQLQTSPLDTPIEIRLFGRSDLDRHQEEDMRTLRRLAGQLKDIVRPLPAITRVRDDWDDESFMVRLQIDPVL